MCGYIWSFKIAEPSTEQTKMNANELQVGFCDMWKCTSLCRPSKKHRGVSVAVMNKTTDEKFPEIQTSPV